MRLQSSLYRAVSEFQIDEAGSALTFTDRLARENGWSVGYARRVVEEYKRFAFLSVVAGHMVAPSDEVDQAWHLHLTYTQSYWTKFCPLLGRRLHHHPTRGGPEEHRKHLSMYEQTLGSYTRVFGHAPPADIWPPAAERFRFGAGHRRVDLERNWVIPKPRFGQVRRVGLVACGAAPLVAASLNPFDFDGPHFLLLYTIFFTAALFAAIYLRRSLLASDSRGDPPRLGPYEVAYLAGGKQAAVHAALAALVQAKVLEVRKAAGKTLGMSCSKGYEVAAAQPLADDAAPLERALCNAAGDGAPILKLQRSVDGEALKLAAPLVLHGLAPSEELISKARWWPAMTLMAVAAFGIVKIFVGLSRHRPVLFLVLAVIGTMVAAAFQLRRPVRTAAGNRLLNVLRNKHSSLRYESPGRFSSGEMALAAALFGSAVLIGGPLGDLRRALAATQSQGGSGSSGCGSGCGGGGCGGGGCGGGGCGGCGS